ncbi:MAG TPA: hypothetical protein VIL65_03885 [Beijerinckiaceae bacterium]
MIDVVEVFWNARPCLERAGVKPNLLTHDARSGRLFDEVRRAVMDAFPGRPTLVRIAVRKSDRDDDGLRVKGNGATGSVDIDGLRRVIQQAVDRAVLPKAL